MNDDLTSDERLLRPLLRAVDQAAQATAPTDHPDEETVALFALGDLPAAQRASVVRHLADCAACRQTAGLVLTVAPEPVPVLSLWKGRRFQIGLLAASVLLAVSLGFLGLYSRGDPEQRTYDRALAALHAGRFDEVRAQVADAARQGIESDRLRNLDAQALRRLPDPVALAAAGRLTQFGFCIDGSAARDPVVAGSEKDLQEAHALLSRPGATDPASLLNRGHLRLAVGMSGEALADFQAAAARKPDDSLAWLGQGLAHFLQKDYTAAAKAFRECLRLDPANAAARINLAMALTEDEKWQDALAAWQMVLAVPLTPAERLQVEKQIELVRRQLQPK